MKLLTVSGPPSSGKTSVILKTVEALVARGRLVGVVKFDCLTTEDDRLYERAGIPVKKGLSGPLCPDHYFVSNVEEIVQWGLGAGFDLLVSESAGLCNRCAPHIKDVMAICVIDNLSGIGTPKKIGPMLKTADIVVITKGDVVSQAEREVFASRVSSVNPAALVLHVNGLTGQGAYELGLLLDEDARQTATLVGQRLRFSMPSALCSYCLGETRIGESYQMGNVRKIDIDRERGVDRARGTAAPGRPGGEGG
jgi:Ni2+-binding GTPase involved in maturation of urease and hydrogenase